MTRWCRKKLVWLRLNWQEHAHIHIHIHTPVCYIQMLLCVFLTAAVRSFMWPWAASHTWKGECVTNKADIWDLIGNTVCVCVCGCRERELALSRPQLCVSSGAWCPNRKRCQMAGGPISGTQQLENCLSVCLPHTHTHTHTHTHKLPSIRHSSSLSSFPQRNAWMLSRQQPPSCWVCACLLFASVVTHTHTHTHIQIHAHACWSSDNE